MPASKARAFLSAGGFVLAGAALAAAAFEASRQATGSIVLPADKAGLAAAAAVLIGCLGAAMLVLRRYRAARAAEDGLHRAAGQDALTGLPNRTAFFKRLEEAVAAASQRDGQMALAIVNLDHFRSVNDIWGHEAGDAVVVEAAARLQAVAGPSASTARLSGDEFAIIYENEANPRSLKYAAQRIIAELSEPFDAQGASAPLSASVGIALYPVNADSAPVLFRAADLALTKAKADGRQTHCFFDTEMEKELKRRTALERDLRLALQRDEFVVFYQPQMDLKRNELCGHEALVRWERPGEGIISPMEFIPVAEETGLIKSLGEWVLRKACEDAVAWIDSGTVAVNFSAAQFRYPGVADMIQLILEDTGLDPRRLEIEITESLFLNHSPEVMATLKRIKALGVRIAMDDFGTGYSSLSYLTRFPFDKIKIDRSFVRQLSDDPQIGAIISSIVGLGRSLSVDITAEGVETEEQVMLLQAAGCSIVQGFLFGAPQRAALIEAREQAARSVAIGA